MKHLLKLSAILVAFLLTAPAFAQTEEDSQLAAAKRILCQSAVTGEETYLLSFLASDKSPALPNLEFACDDEGHTPMHYAVSGNHLPIIKGLLVLGAKIDSLAVTLAVTSDFVEIAELFVSMDVDLCIPFENSKLGKPASSYAQSDTMKALLEKAEKDGAVAMFNEELKVCKAK